MSQSAPGRPAKHKFARNQKCAIVLLAFSFVSLQQLFYSRSQKRFFSMEQPNRIINIFQQSNIIVIIQYNSTKPWLLLQISHEKRPSQAKERLRAVMLVRVQRSQVRGSVEEGRQEDRRGRGRGHRYPHPQAGKS